MLDSHVALYWRVSLGSVPSSCANPLQDDHNWQCTKDHSGTSNAHPAREKTRRTGVEPNGVVELEHAQRRSSNPWSLLSTDVHILACVHSTGP